MRIDILTLFPDMFQNVLGESMLKIAREKELVSFHLHNIRDFSHDKHRCVDDKPYGGGAGMVMKPEPVFNAVEAVELLDDAVPTKILLTPQGETFNQRIAHDLSKQDRLMIICGRYEGFDERIRSGIDVLEISIGDYVLTGGEIPAMAIIDSVTRLVPGVLGGDNSLQDESFVDRMLEYPQYTRPAEFRGMKVPEVLKSGHHSKIEEWKMENAILRTQERRPDLLKEKTK
ncbi:MAG: tRNA (guanosine(37)-N1)-methyltransferase TrmD [Candidatus Scalindua sp.]|jgi:tRNA (guanine37-N1)-methyltransferase|nr:tRNA (guanosine(37)-N1)-methyltransferase TrmD [Candidatus Scalindua sp.]MBT5303612.1 tRNA (guanosine(37)-N1)-methyltransferase TrmD [Candidatus Scalindua sp.]MBT6227945.1 tRNA (guanosine(37)-N1)-methyltransferase TrmD [Candidatus Scalindua sp.]MBT6563960.1 tRNA (guanosine(37)-N1)-methyltransferase TrmD [Candidatus Scalindua sp.]MBT7211416.1 tRNA (guanosine(37)-N1)-methyltransferase TrmD [Candidatus Scalindua sp.]